MSLYATDNYNSGTGVTEFFFTGNQPAATPVTPVASTVYKSGIFTRYIQENSGTVNIAHNLGVIPKKITFNSTYRQSNNPFSFSRSFGVFDSSGNKNVNESVDGLNSDTTYVIYIYTGSIITQRGQVSVDATNIIVNWSANTGGSLNGDIQILFSAEG